MNDYDRQITIEFWLHILWIAIAIIVAILLVYPESRHLFAFVERVQAEDDHDYTEFYQTSAASWQAPAYKTIDATSTITAYSSSIDETDSTPFQTASGIETRLGIIACPEKIPFGSVVETPWGQYICEDRMNKKHEGKFDIWMENKDEAKQFGVKIVPIKINIFY